MISIGIYKICLFFSLIYPVCSTFDQDNVDNVAADITDDSSSNLIGDLNPLLNLEDLEKQDGPCARTNVQKSFFNGVLDNQNPSNLCSPSTDEGGMESFKYSSTSSARNWHSGGWVSQVTTKEFPISKNMAGILVYMKPGAIREMHWHHVGEWALILYGKVRVTLVDNNGRAFVDDIEAGNLWYFPHGYPHSIQVIGNQPSFAIGGFNDGATSFSNTINIANWLNHVPRDVLAKNFQVPQSTFANLPKKLIMFNGKQPQPLQIERLLAANGTGYVPKSFSFYANQMKPNVVRKGGNIKIIDGKNFPATQMTFAIVTLKPGAIRELHWHTTSDEWQYYIKGKARMGIYLAGNVARTMDFQTGDVGYVPQSLGHYIENTGQDDVVYIEVFTVKYYEDISLAEWLAHTPPVLVNENIRTGPSFINNINKEKVMIMP